MTDKKRILVAVIAASLALLAAARLSPEIRAAADNPEASFTIPWFTIDAGGGESQGGAYRLHGTLGQADAHTASGGSYTLKGGFWSGLVDYEYRVHMPLIYR